MATGQIIGQEWADKYPEKFRDPDPPRPTACIICGDPTTSCTGHEDTDDE